MASCCTLFNVRHSPRTSHGPWTNGVVEVKNKNFLAHLRLFLHDAPENWSIQVSFFPYAHKTQPFLHLHISPYELSVQPRIPLNFQLNRSRNSFRQSTAKNCSQFFPHFYSQSTDWNPLFLSIMLKLISTGFLAFETAMLQISSKIYQYALGKKFPCIQHVKNAQSGYTITTEFISVTSKR